MERGARAKAAVSVSLVGLQNGQREFEVVVPASSIEGLVSEYQTDVQVRGTVYRNGRKLHVSYTVNADALLVCDRSLEEFVEPISVDGELDYAFDGELHARQQGVELDPEEVRGLRDDAQEIDLTDDVRQDLAIAIPMKRVSPAYRDVEISSLLPEEPQSSTPDDRWAALQKLSKK